MSKEDKKDKKDCGSKKHLMLAFGLATLGTRVVSALSLAVIAFSFCSLKKEAKVFTECVEEVRESGIDASGAVRFCNGGTTNSMPNS